MTCPASPQRVPGEWGTAGPPLCQMGTDRSVKALGPQQHPLTDGLLPFCSPGFTFCSEGKSFNIRDLPSSISPAKRSSHTHPPCAHLDEKGMIVRLKQLATGPLAFIVVPNNRQSMRLTIFNQFLLPTSENPS